MALPYIETPGTSGWGPVADGNVYGANLERQNFNNSGWGRALGLATSFLGGGSGRQGNVPSEGYFADEKKKAEKEEQQVQAQDSVKEIFSNFKRVDPVWTPQSNPQQFAQQYAASGGGGSSSGGGNKGLSALGGAASGAQIGSMIAPGIGTAIGAGLGAIGGFFCDVRLKLDIAPLERSDVHDELAEMAFLVKEIRECA